MSVCYLVFGILSNGRVVQQWNYLVSSSSFITFTCKSNTGTINYYMEFWMYFCYLKFHGHVVQSSDRFTMTNFTRWWLSLMSLGNTSLEAALLASLEYACSGQKFRFLNSVLPNEGWMQCCIFLLSKVCTPLSLG